MKIHINEDNVIDGIAYIGPMDNSIDIDDSELPNDFSLLKYKYIDGKFVPNAQTPTLNEVISSKLFDLSNACENIITNGVDIDGFHYSMSDKDQINLEVLKNTIKDGATEVAYHADNESCRMYTKDEFMKIYLTCMAHKIHHTTYYNQLKRYVKSLTDIKEITDITYGQELTGEYLETYNEIYNWLLSLQGLYS